MSDLNFNALFDLAVGRSRSSWNDRLSHWERPASDSEEAQIERVAGMIRSGLSRNMFVAAEAIKILPQGSYYNNTNVRATSDMDIRAEHPYIRLEYADGVDVPTARRDLGVNDIARTLEEIAAQMRHEMHQTLEAQFGFGNVDSSGNKAIKISHLPGSRAPADVVPTFRYFWVEKNFLTGRHSAAEGVAILSRNGVWTNNFPVQHHENGIAKRGRTKHRFKKLVRSLKSLRDELEILGKVLPKRTPSFLVECLVYSVEDAYFLQEIDDRYDRMLRIVRRIAEKLNDSDWVKTATEINEIKYLFHLSQPWSLADTKAFASAALERLGG